MQQLKILIADDERLARQAILLALPGEGRVHIIIEAGNGADAIEAIKKQQPDIIFLDIQMPELTGMEVLQQLPTGYAPYIIIVSAYDHYALQAFERDASDYLLKPFTAERFNKAFHKALTHAGKEEQNSWKDTFANLNGVLSRLLDAQPHKERLSVKEGERIIIVPCDEIIYLQADGEYTALHTAQRKYLHNSSLSALDGQLDPRGFVRIHRSSIVNVRYIRELNSHNNGDYTVTLLNGEQLKLSRNYRAQLLQLIG